MENIINKYSKLNAGLPEVKQNDSYLLKQFNISRVSGVNSGFLLLEDGQLYFLKIDKRMEDHIWQPFTKIKPEGLQILRELILEDFIRIKDGDCNFGSAENFLLWQANINSKRKNVIVDSGPYSGLPSVMKKMDDTINRFMLRLNEVIE